MAAITMDARRKNKIPGVDVMKKKQFEDKRFRVLEKVNKAIDGNCKGCEHYNIESIQPCLTCPAFKELNNLGKELERITKVYRESNSIAKSGINGHLEVEVIQDNRIGREKLMDMVTFEELKAMKKIGMSWDEIGLKYGTSRTTAFNLYREYNGDERFQRNNKPKKVTMTEKINEYMDFDKYLYMKEHEKKSVRILAAEIGVTMKSVEKWVYTNRKEQLKKITDSTLSNF